jgi:hypothetical protein
MDGKYRQKREEVYRVVQIAGSPDRLLAIDTAVLGRLNESNLTQTPFSRNDSSKRFESVVYDPRKQRADEEAIFAEFALL